MAVVKEILRSRNILLVVLIPLLLLPLPLLYPCSEASCAYVLIVTAVYWVSEAVPLGAAALIPAFLYPLFGVMKSSEVAAEYFKNTTLLLMGVICVAASVEKWNLHKRIALRMVMMAGAKPGMLLLCFMCCTTVLSMWLSNTSTTAMVMPIVEAVLQELVNAEEERDVISTAGSTTIEENEPIGLNEKHDQPSLELIFINEELLAQITMGNINATGFISSAAKDPVSKLIIPSRLSVFSKFSKSFLENGATEKEEQSLTHNVLLRTKLTRDMDHLIVQSAQILVLPPKPSELDLSTKYRYQSRHDHMICKCLSLSISYAATIGGLTTIIGTSTSLIFLEHFNNFKETCSLSKKKKTKREEMSERRIHEEYKKLGNVSYPEMVTGFFFILMTLLWFTREPGFVPGWSSFFEKKGYRTDATVSVFLGFLLFLIPAKKPCFGKKEKGDAERSTDTNTLDPIITWKDFQKTMPWEIVVLVGGGYALAAGCKSETLLINPLYTLIPVTMCISFAVMLPVGNPPNAIVFSYGHCQIKDMVIAGLGVNLIGLAVVMVAINTWGIRLFQLNTFPEWAAVSNVTSQT
ncbi:solute carrier family 13 member 4 [Tympanuchus pallidicinctus]|uniref:solute carrier family 13 member 4 n=1 Tax=Tympanuchus pallidicinctus TaxID=109042 RepID=UPI002286E997|nr:solute carrier family 13 member 4 [Tympanuchus pallidicinctus]